MQEIIKEYNANHVTDVCPPITGYVSNEMSSNYYFTWQGQEMYVDQYDLQESFDYESPDNGDCNSYENESVSDIAYALAELVQAQTVGL